MPKPKLTRISTVDLRRELDRRAASAVTLEVKRVELTNELARIDAEIAALGGQVLSIAAPTGIRRSRTTKRRGVSSAARTRAANKVPLHAALHSLLNGKTMGVAEVAEAVQKAGYKTNAGSFRTIVNLTLLKRKDLFRKKGRGQYTAK